MTHVIEILVVEEKLNRNTYSIVRSRSGLAYSKYVLFAPSG